ncbi:MAG: four helix bundle protein [Limisphaerales bacterium]
MSLSDFRDLECWKCCRALRVFIAREVVGTLPKLENYLLRQQILDAARSTTANIAEGYGRFHYRDNARFCRIARGSCYEVVDHLITANDEQLIPLAQLQKGEALATEAIRVLNGYIRYLVRASENQTPHSGAS